MEENNQLNDIILNKSNSSNSNKKILLAVATLGLILIIVVMLMNSLSSNGTDNLPQAVLPPQPQTATEDMITQEPLFEDIEVVEEAAPESDLDMIAQKLKQESLEETHQQEVKATPAPKKVYTKKPVVKKPVKKHVTAKKTEPKKVITRGSYFIQVGSFSKYEPNKKFLKSITSLGYNYEYRKVKSLNKVLVGPFRSESEAKKARSVLRSKVEPGAFLVRI